MTDPEDTARNGHSRLGASMMAGTVHSYFQKSPTSVALNTSKLHNPLNKLQTGKAGHVTQVKPSGFRNYFHARGLSQNQCPGGIAGELPLRCMAQVPYHGQPGSACHTGGTSGLGRGPFQSPSCSPAHQVQSPWPVPLWLKDHSITCHSN